jgi:hypothetical protein
MKDKKTQTSQEWEIERWNRQNRIWQARQERWNAYKKTQKK